LLHFVDAPIDELQEVATAAVKTAALGLVGKLSHGKRATGFLENGADQSRQRGLGRLTIHYRLGRGRLWGRLRQSKGGPLGSRSDSGHLCFNLLELGLKFLLALGQGGELTLTGLRLPAQGLEFRRLVGDAVLEVFEREGRHDRNATPGDGIVM